MHCQTLQSWIWVISILSFVGADALRQTGKSYIGFPDILHWAEIENRDVDTTAMVSSLLRTTSEQAPPHIFTYNVKEDGFLSKEIQTSGVWEVLPMMIICNLAKKSGMAGNFLDVGANVGAYSLAVMPCLKNNSIVYSVEAVPGNVDRLIASVQANRFDNVVVVPNAVGSPSDPPTITMEVGRLTKAGSMRSNGKKLDPHWGSLSEVKLTTLDSIAEREPGMKKLLFMKMDIEGSEGHALKGAKKLLSEAPPCYVMIELNPGLLERVGSTFRETVDLLASAGYDTSNIPPKPSLYFLQQRNTSACLQRLHGSPVSVA